MALDGSVSSLSKSALSVFVRVRPLAQMERRRGAFECVRVVDSQSLLLVDPEKPSGNALRQNRTHEREFRFDAVLAPGTGEEEVQSLVGTEGLVDGLVRFGLNGTVLAYGPTGTGKTHTMVGTRERPGLMTRVTRALYEQLAEMGDRKTRVYISFMELYNELIRDLLRAEKNGPLELLEDERGTVHIPGLSRVRASNTSKLLQLLQEGNARRTTEPTAANSTSSRSHALLMISLWKDKTERGRLFLIDLAGSERAINTQNQGQRLKEGAAINRSLLALGNVINSLSNASGGRRPAFVNFRDSKLTRLLKDALGGAGENGAGRTVLIAHISPSSTAYNETFNTLTYASRAKGIAFRDELLPLTASILTLWKC
uniref:Kinesin-like protein n=1 Tax=Globodera rostochiensis TaxID=31243 RepID=A0A914H9N0_GLORO